jgi:ArsR family transcriptional regulator, cadmium/lead-responsive transcriptional repressor
MAMIPSSHDRNCRVGLTPAVSLFRSLGDPTRLAIVHELAKGERRVVDLTRHLGLAQSTVSAHLALMRQSGVVQSRPRGRQSLHRLSRPELFTVLTAAESLLAATGNDVELCPPSDSSDETRLVDAAASDAAASNAGSVVVVLPGVVSSRVGSSGVGSSGGARLVDPAASAGAALTDDFDAPVAVRAGLVRNPAASAGVTDVAAA